MSRTWVCSDGHSLGPIKERPRPSAQRAVPLRNTRRTPGIGLRPFRRDPHGATIIGGRE